jgi:hypothetical protein
MIDWFNIAANALWIVACAWALATFSYASWEASYYHEKLRQRLGRAGIQLSFSLAGALFCAGLAATSQGWLRIGVWVVLCLLFLAQALPLARQRKQH